MGQFIFKTMLLGAVGDDYIQCLYLLSFENWFCSELSDIFSYLLVFKLEKNECNARI